MEPTVAKLQSDGSQLLRKCQDPASTNIKQSMQLLQQTWEHVKSRSADRKVCNCITGKSFKWNTVLISQEFEVLIKDWYTWTLLNKKMFFVNDIGWKAPEITV